MRKQLNSSLPVMIGGLMVRMDTAGPRVELQNDGFNVDHG